jgi:uncharacterized membrane protein HdeD (DUF308 family)
LNITIRGVVAVMAGIFCGGIAFYLVPGPTYIRALVVVGIIAVVIGVLLLLTSRSMRVNGPAERMGDVRERIDDFSASRTQLETKK